jgi:hypothetical protein
MRMPKQLPAVERKRNTIASAAVAGSVRPARYYGGLTTEMTPMCRICADAGCFAP